MFWRFIRDKAMVDTQCLRITAANANVDCLMNVFGCKLARRDEPEAACLFQTNQKPEYICASQTRCWRTKSQIFFCHLKPVALCHDNLYLGQKPVLQWDPECNVYLTFLWTKHWLTLISSTSWEGDAAANYSLRSVFVSYKQTIKITILSNHD